MDPSGPARAPRIYVTSLEDMPQQVERLRPGYLVSIIQVEFQPPTPASVAPRRHHRLAIDDIVEPTDGATLVDRDGVRRLLDYLGDWAGRESLLVHCYAGISRSPAAALIAHFMVGGDAHASARALRRAAPHAFPNRRIIALADDLLGCRGRLARACQAIGGNDLVDRVPRVAALPLPRA